MNRPPLPEITVPAYREIPNDNDNFFNNLGNVEERVNIQRMIGLAPSDDELQRISLRDLKKILLAYDVDFTHELYSSVIKSARTKEPLIRLLLTRYLPILPMRMVYEQLGTWKYFTNKQKSQIINKRLLGFKHVMNKFHMRHRYTRSNLRALTHPDILEYINPTLIDEELINVNNDLKQLQEDFENVLNETLRRLNTNPDNFDSNQNNLRANRNNSVYNTEFQLANETFYDIPPLIIPNNWSPSKGNHEYSNNANNRDPISRNLVNNNSRVYLIPDLTPDGKITQIYDLNTLKLGLKVQAVSPLTRKKINLDDIKFAPRKTKRKRNRQSLSNLY